MKIEDSDLVKRIFEAALMASERPLQRKDLVALFDEDYTWSHDFQPCFEWIPE